MYYEWSYISAFALSSSTSFSFYFFFSFFFNSLSFPLLECQVEFPTRRTRHLSSIS